MSTEYNNPLTPAPLPLVEQVQVKTKNKGVNIPTFIISLVVIAALLGAGGWFLGSSSGYSSAQSDFRTSPQSFSQSAGGTGGFGSGGTGGPGATGGAAGPTGGPGGSNTGKITAINGSTITLETANSTITVNIDSSTKVTKINPGATSDLKVGDNVTVTGTTAGATVNAVNIILGNITGLLGRPGGSGGTGGAPASSTPAAGGNG